MLRALLAFSFLCLGVSSARADTVSWVDWTTSDPNSVYGVVYVDGSTISVTYTGERGFVQTSCGTNYWIATTAINPYTSAIVDNPPDQDPDPARRCDIIALSFATEKTLEFSEPVTNPLFAVVSLNGNGYRFDRDFDILSFGPGYWGNGTLTKQISTYPDGSVTYDLIGTGEPHGVIQFIGTFSTVTWNSLSNEYWNGFSIAVEHLAVNVPPEIEVFARGAAITDGQATPIDLGAYEVGTSTTIEIVIANSGAGPLNIFGVRLFGGDTSAFRLGTVVPAVAAGASTIVELTYTASVALTSTTTVIIESDDADESEFDFPIVGRVFVDDDLDDDGVPTAEDCNDSDPSIWDPIRYYEDADGDGFGDAGSTLDVCSNDAPDGYVADASDNCPLVANADQLDLDGDGIGDACDDDVDGDGVDAAEDCDDRDATLSAETTYYPDEDGDGHGTDPGQSFCADSAPPGFTEVPSDNCPTVANPDQADADGDGIGTACDPDESPSTPPPIDEEEKGCDCSAAHGDRSPAFGLLSLALLGVRRRRRRTERAETTDG